MSTAGATPQQHHLLGHEPQLLLVPAHGGGARTGGGLGRVLEVGGAWRAASESGRGGGLRERVGEDVVGIGEGWRRQVIRRRRTRERLLVIGIGVAPCSCSMQRVQHRHGNVGARDLSQAAGGSGRDAAGPQVLGSGQARTIPHGRAQRSAVQRYRDPTAECVTSVTRLGVRLRLRWPDRAGQAVTAAIMPAIQSLAVQSPSQEAVGVSRACPRRKGASTSPVWLRCCR